MPIIVRGEGCYVYDEHGKRYLDGLSALFCVNIGHGRADIAQAGADQAKELGFFTNWSYAHPPAIELAARIASLAPGDLNRVFFTSGGSEAVESALKLARQYHKLTGKPNKTKLIAREIAYHGTTLGALSATGITGLRTPFEPLTPGGCHVPNTNTYRLPPGMTEEYFAEAIAERIEFEGPDTVAAVILEPVQNAGGCFTPPEGYFQRVREICDEYDVLLISDEVICAWGRLGEWFGAAALRLPAGHHHHGQGPDQRVRADGRGDRLRPRRRAVHDRHQQLHARVHVRRAPDVRGDRAGQPRRVRARGRARERARATRARSGRCSSRCATCRSSATCAAPGYFHAIELVKDKDTKESFDDEESETLLRGFLSGELYRRGLICRADDRGDPVIQLSPPLIAGPEQFDEIEAILRAGADRGRRADARARRSPHYSALEETRRG